jgi:hypothetical protein
VKLRGLRAGVTRGDANADIVGRSLGVFGIDLPVPIAIEYPGVEKLEFRLIPRAMRVFRPEPLIGKLGLWIVIAPPEPRGGRRRVEIPPIFLSVLAVITLRPAQAKNTFFQDRIAPVPERESKAEALLAVAKAR